MPYELSPNDRFFLNQMISRWDNIKPIDLQGDLKYVFHREMGSGYNTTQFDNTLENLSSFLSDFGFAKENPVQKYTFSLLPKGNSLRVKGTIEQFEFYQEQERITGKAMYIPPNNTNATRQRQDIFIPGQQESRGGPSIIRIIFIIAILAIIAFYVIKNYE